MQSDKDPPLRLRLLAIASAISVANPFYSQLLLPQIAYTFHLESGRVLLIPTVTLIGMALGFQFLLPFGDIVRHRSLLIALALGLCLACLGVASTPTFPLLLAVFFGLGLLSCIPALLPVAVSAVTAEEERGRSLGLVLSGTFCGIILARSVCGLIAQAWGWQSVYLLASFGMLAVAQILRIGLPNRRSSTDATYWQLQISLLTLWRKHSGLRMSSITNTMLFSCYLGIWSLLPLHLSERPWNFGPAIIGTFGFLGLGSIVAAPWIGRIIDQRGSESVIRSGIMSCVVALMGMALLRDQLVAIVIGIIALDLGFKSSNLANQARLQRLDRSAGSRMNGQYFMVSYVGAALLSGVISGLWPILGWAGSCLLMVSLACLAWSIEARGQRVTG